MERRSTADSYGMCCACGVWIRQASDIALSTRRDGEGLLRTLELENGFRKAYDGLDLSNDPNYSHVIHATHHAEALEIVMNAPFANKGFDVDMPSATIKGARYRWDAHDVKPLQVQRIYDKIVAVEPVIHMDQQVYLCRRCNMAGTNGSEFTDLLYRAKRPLIRDGELKSNPVNHEKSLLPHLVCVLVQCWDTTWNGRKRQTHMCLCWMVLSVCACLRDLVFDASRHVASQHTRIANLEFYVGVFMYYMLLARNLEVHVTLEDFLLLYFYELASCPKNRKRDSVLNLVMPSNYEAITTGDQTVLFNAVVERLVNFFEEWIEGYVYPVIAEDAAADADATEFFPSKADARFLKDRCMPIVGRNVVGYINALGINFMLNRFELVTFCCTSEFRSAVDRNVFNFFMDREIREIRDHQRNCTSRQAQEKWLQARRMGLAAARQHKSAGACVFQQNQEGALRGA